MADEHDPFEAELASFRPQPVSTELRERIGADLTPRPIRWVAAVAGLAAAACVVVGVVMWNRNAKVVSDPPHLPMLIVAENSPPTVMDYQRAFAKSSDALDALLATPARRETRGDEQPAAAPLRAFGRSFIDFANSNGDQE